MPIGTVMLCRYCSLWNSLLQGVVEATTCQGSGKDQALMHAECP